MRAKTNAIDAAVGARIRNLRLRNKLSQTDVGDDVGVTFQQIQKYENGANRVRASRLSQLAKLFGVPITAFYGEVGDQSEGSAQRAKGISRISDTAVERLVKACQAIKDKKLRAALLEAAQQMVRCQRRK